MDEAARSPRTPLEHHSPRNPQLSRNSLFSEIRRAARRGSLKPAPRARVINCKRRSMSGDLVVSRSLPTPAQPVPHGDDRLNIIPLTGRAPPRSPPGNEEAPLGLGVLSLAAGSGISRRYQSASGNPRDRGVNPRGEEVPARSHCALLLPELQNERRGAHQTREWQEPQQTRIGSSKTSRGSGRESSKTPRPDNASWDLLPPALDRKNQGSDP